MKKTFFFLAIFGLASLFAPSSAKIPIPDEVSLTESELPLTTVEKLLQIAIAEINQVTGSNLKIGQALDCYKCGHLNIEQLGNDQYRVTYKSGIVIVTMGDDI